MERRVTELEKRVHKLEAKWNTISYWFTDRPELDNYASPSVVAFREYLDGLESEGGSSLAQIQDRPASKPGDSGV